jgi:hypothetical protein
MIHSFGFLFLLYCHGLLCFYSNQRSSCAVMLFDKVLEHWCDVVDACSFAMVEGE